MATATVTKDVNDVPNSSLHPIDRVSVSDEKVGFDDDDDNDSEATFVIELTTDEKRASLLGPKVQRNGPAYESQPRREVTTLEPSSYTLHVGCRRPRYGLAEDDDVDATEVSATLIVLDVFFQPRIESSVRFKRAEITVSVEDAETLNINAHEECINQPYQPSVLRCQPTNYESPTTQLIGKNTGSLGASISDPGNIAGFSASGSSAKPSVKEGQFSVHAVSKEYSVRWVLLENKIKKTGLPPKITLGTLVKCTPGRKFAVTVSVQAVVRLTLRQDTPLAGEKDDPLFFTHAGQKRTDLKAELDKLGDLDYLFENKRYEKIVLGDGGA